MFDLQYFINSFFLNGNLKFTHIFAVCYVKKLNLAYEPNILNLFLS
jgi:hypothetical protein